MDTGGAVDRGVMYLSSTAPNLWGGSLTAPQWHTTGSIGHMPSGERLPPPPLVLLSPPTIPHVNEKKAPQRNIEVRTLNRLQLSQKTAPPCIGTTYLDVHPADIPSNFPARLLHCHMTSGKQQVMGSSHPPTHFHSVRGRNGEDKEEMSPSPTHTLTAG